MWPPQETPLSSPVDTLLEPFSFNASAENLDELEAQEDGEKVPPEDLAAPHTPPTTPVKSEEGKP